MGVTALEPTQELGLIALAFLAGIAALTGLVALAVWALHRHARRRGRGGWLEVQPGQRLAVQARAEDPRDMGAQLDGVEWPWGPRVVLDNQGVHVYPRTPREGE